MAGRGRGRGRGTISFDVESLGFGRGEALPTACLEPQPLYPPLQFKPVPLISDEEHDYLLTLKQEFRSAMKESPYCIKPLEKKRDIERYSDKYQLTNNENSGWKIDWKRFPSELRIKKKTTLKSVKPNLGKGKVKVKVEDITKTLEKLEQKEKSDETTVGDADEGEAEKEEDEGEEVEEEELDEEELEDDTDYNQTYFDNGENYGMDEEEDIDDGPTY